MLVFPFLLIRTLHSYPLILTTRQTDQSVVVLSSSLPLPNRPSIRTYNSVGAPERGGVLDSNLHPFDSCRTPCQSPNSAFCSSGEKPTDFFLSFKRFPPAFRSRHIEINCPCIPQLQHSRLDTFSLWRLVSGIFSKP